MADNDIKNNELSSEETAQIKKRTSKKSTESKSTDAPKPRTRRKPKVEEPIEVVDETIEEAPIEEVAEAVVDASTEEIAEAVADAPIEEVAEAVADAPIEEVAEAVVDAPIEEIAEAVVDAPAEEIAEAVVDAPTEEVAEAVVEIEEDTLPSPVEIEHFSDYKSSKIEDTEETTEAYKDAPAVYDTEEEENEENLPDDEEYENLTILDHGLFAEAISGAQTNNEYETAPKPRDERKEDPDSEKYDPKKPRKVDGRFEFIELFVFTLVAVMLITTFLFRHSVVEGESMENTLFAGEHLIITDVFYKPKCGDIIVFEDYSTGYTTAIVKRVIATEGQTVRIAKEGVYVDGVFLDNEYYAHADAEDYNYLANVDSRFIEDYTIPEGEVFVMGDHRDHSSDSRTFGTIHEETILGKVILRFYPFNKFGSVYKDN